MRLSADGTPVSAAEKNNMGGTLKTKDDLNEGKDLKEGATKCLSCYGAGATTDECCNTCDEVKQAYARKGWQLPILSMRNHIKQCAHEGFDSSLEQKGEGCNVHGNFEVAKVSGNFHFGPSNSFQHAHLYTFDLMSFTTDTFNISHTVHSISYGPSFPGQVSPLTGVQRVLGKDDGSGMFQYYCQIVPTAYQPLGGGELLESNQYAVTEHMRKISSVSQRWLPGVYFFYDISSIKVTTTEERRGLVQFLTSVCAIIGGVFTVMGLVDSFVYSLAKKAGSDGLGI